MAFSIRDLFSSAPATPPVTPPPSGTANPGTPLPGTQASAQTDVNGIVPKQPGDVNAGGDPGTSNASPLAPFSDVWKTDPNAANPAPGMFANLDPAKVMESAKKVNFSGSITPEALQAIQAGGEGAITAFRDSLNAVAQNVYAQSAIATTKIVEQALGKAKESQAAELPSMIRKLSINDSIASSNPALSNPAIQPLVGALTTVLTQKNPNASATEIQKQVVDYFNAIGNTFAPAIPEPKNSAARKEDDWSAFFSQ